MSRPHPQPPNTSTNTHERICVVECISCDTEVSCSPNEAEIRGQRSNSRGIFSTAMDKQIRWLPLESNPEVMNKYAKNLGVSGSYEFVDVYGLDQDMLGMVPHPVTAVLLLYPISEKSEATKLGTEEDTKDVYFIKQTIGNACGTIGLIHALANNSDSIAMAGDKALAKFLAKTKDSSPDERGKVLEEDSDIGAAHEESAQEGQTQAPPRDEKVNLHFVAFVHKNGGLYEMDGRKSVPTRHGNTTAETLLEDAAKVVQKFMQRDPEQLNFTVVALAKTD